jgi:Protein of unknown function (DUF3313)
MTRTLHALFGLGSALVLALTSGCISSGSGVPTLGFLEDYTQLSPGREGQASLVYIDGEVDFSLYSAIAIDPVVARSLDGGDPTDVTRDLAMDLDAALRRELALEFELVEEPREGALHMRAALASDASGHSKGPSHLVLEAELLDGGTGSRVIGLVDDRPVGEPDEAKGSAAQIDTWAVLTRDRLATFRNFDSAWHAREDGAAP